MTGHTVSLNADGTQEETVEFTSQVNPQIFAATGSAGTAVKHQVGALIKWHTILGKDVSVYWTTEQMWTAS